MFYVFHGDDEFTRSEAIAELKAKMGDPSWLALNTTVLRGSDVTLAKITHVCDSVPFFGERRLVIVEDWLGQFEPGEDEGQGGNGSSTTAEELIAYLGRLPETARLIFVESRSLSRKNPVVRYAERARHGFVKEFKRPRPGELNRWIQARLRAKGGTITPSALAQLAAFVGNDLRLLDMELDKLITYVGTDRPINDRDVRLLVAAVQESSIFRLVDALGYRDGQRALAILRELLDAGHPPAYLMYMITRQFRILLQVRELLDRHLGPRQIQAELGLHPYVAEKALRQARNFTPAQIERTYDRLVEADEAMKTGRSDPGLALELLVVSLVGMPAVTRRRR
jgi:DNA polymerase-3 subunit delta